jgi:hypothetical protein
MYLTFKKFHTSDKLCFTRELGYVTSYFIVCVNISIGEQTWPQAVCTNMYGLNFMIVVHAFLKSPDSVYTVRLRVITIHW